MVLWNDKIGIRWQMVYKRWIKCGLFAAQQYCLGFIILFFFYLIWVTIFYFSTQFYYGDPCTNAYCSFLSIKHVIRFNEFRNSFLGTLCNRLTFFLFIIFLSMIRQYSWDWFPTPHLVKKISLCMSFRE